jgi:hypothetical protein
MSGPCLDGRSADPPGDGRHDFDFIFGGWKVHNRKLRDPTLMQCHDWIEFDTTALAYPILGGLGHVLRIWSDADSADGPWEVFVLGQFSPADRLWWIWWTSTMAPGQFGPPLTGGFDAGVGRFTGADRIASRPVKARLECVNPQPRRICWSRKLSFDEGRSWHVSWTMQFTRISRRKPSDHRWLEARARRSDPEVT